MSTNTEIIVIGLSCTIFPEPAERLNMARLIVESRFAKNTFTKNKFNSARGWLE